MPRTRRPAASRHSKPADSTRRAARGSAGVPTSRSSVPIAYEPPEIPPKKKYARIHHSQFGGAAKCSAGGIGLLIHPLRAEREHTGDEAEDRGDEAARVPREVV